MTIVTILSCSFVTATLFIKQNRATSTDPNYFIDKFEGGESYLAYPLNICLNTGIQTKEIARYACNSDGTQVTRTYYSDSGCTTATTTTTFDSSNVQSNGAYSFNCDGHDSYVELDICVNSNTCSGCLVTGTTHSVIDICHYAGNGTSNTVVMGACDASTTTVKTYTRSTTCNGTVATDFSAASNTCGDFDEVQTSFGTFDVFALVCVFVVSNFV